jgi:hypothetical protein
VGCVNTRGLPDHEWLHALELVEEGVFHFLFLLETWHVDHVKRRLHPRLLAATEPPTTSGTGTLDNITGTPSGRHSGGVAVLVSAYASALVLGVDVSPLGEAVTVTTRHGVLTGLYLPPSMPEDRVAPLLASVSSSDIVFGDMNVRFPGLECQYGTPGPKPRLTTFLTWLDGEGSFDHVLPDPKPDTTSLSCESLLNLDHCFVRRAFRYIHLSLPSTKHLGFHSDHKYALSFVLGGDCGVGATSPDCRRLDLPRYRIQSLGDPEKSLALSSAWKRYHLTIDAFESRSNIGRRTGMGNGRPSTDLLNSNLVDTLGLVCEAALGKQRPSPRFRPRRRKSSLKRHDEDPSPRRSHLGTPNRDISDQEDGIDVFGTPRPRSSSTSELLGEIQVLEEGGANVLGRPDTLRSPGSLDRPNPFGDNLLGSLDRPNPFGDDLLGSIGLYKRAAKSSLENGPLLPTKDGLARRMSALEEVSHRFAERFTQTRTTIMANPLPYAPRDNPTLTSRDRIFQDDPTLTSRDRIFQDDLSPFTTEEVAGELALQDASKACGADGIHIRVLRHLAISEPTFLDALTSLYNSCFASGTTPAAWNDTLIHLLIKDVSLPKDADNVRPITLISIIRKVFERLLLSRFDLSGWAAVHPLQAGFKARHSTYTNAAAVHALLESGLVSHVAFLDFRSAFDVVDHSILSRILRERGCPPRMLALISHLTFDGIRSTVLSDSDAGPTFVRGRGVLQGSPLSPHLFNIFVDGLLRELEAAGATRLPTPADSTCLPVAGSLRPTAMSIVPTLFYADDGILLASSLSDVQYLLDITTTWCRGNGMELNIKKCGYLTSGPSTFLASDSLASPTVSGSPLPRVDEYTYLGFPVTPKGIDFRKHLTTRIEKAVARASFLSVFSDGWGPAHRLRVYRTYLAPMFEYGAPLVAAHAETGPAFYDGTITKPFSDLVGWIASGKANPDLTANLLGLEPLESRFRSLKAMFQLNLRSLPDESPLKRMRALGWSPNSFYYHLTEDALFRTFVVALPVEKIAIPLRFQYCPERNLAAASPPTRALLVSYLSKKREERAAVDTQRWRLAKVIPRATRLKRDLRGADLTLRAPRRFQTAFLHYRRGIFAANYACLCPEPPHRFRRGHEVYASPVPNGSLSLKERALKHRIRSKLPVRSAPFLFTDVDFLLNRGEFARAHAILRGVLRDLAIKKAIAKATASLNVGGE